MLSTQISGKFSNKDNSIFILKSNLEKRGIKVRFPASEKIISSWKGIPTTFEVCNEKSFYDVEVSFFNSIKYSTFHVLNAQHKDFYGYVGESAAIEVAYALIKGKAIFTTYPIYFSDTVDKKIKQLILKNISKIHHLNFSVCNDILLLEITKMLSSYQPPETDIEDELIVYKSVELIFSKYL